MTGPREWRHAEGCSEWEEYESLDLLGNINYTPGECTCGLSAVRDAIAAGHRVVIGPDGVEGRLEKEWQGYTPVPVIVPLGDEREPEPCRLCGQRPAHYGYWCAPCLRANPDPQVQPYVPAPVDPEEG